MRPYGIMRRTVYLEKGWYRDATGAMLGVLKESGRVVALIPGRISGYTYFDYTAGKPRKVNSKNQEMFEKEAIAFYKPFPLKKMGISTLVKYIFENLSTSDYVMMVMATLAVTLVGMLTPKINNIVFSQVLPSGSRKLLFAITIFSVCVSVSSILLTAVNKLVTARINTKLGLFVETATMMRILSLPADFFREYSAGELASRARQTNVLCEMLVSAVFTTGLTSVLSLVYISQIFRFAPALVVPAFIIIIVTVLFSIISSFVQMSISKEQMELSGKENGLTYALITGVQKIKLSGAEKKSICKMGKFICKRGETAI